MDDTKLISELRSIYSRLGILLAEHDKQANVLSVVKSRDGWQQVMDHYKKYHPRAFPKVLSTLKEAKKIQARLKEGFSVEDLIEAIDGCHRSEYHQGQNDQNKKYDSLELIVRDGSKVQQFIEINRTSGNELPPVSDRAMNGHRLLAGMDENA
jgi:hypothetical protein